MNGGNAFCRASIKATMIKCMGAGSRENNDCFVDLEIYFFYFIKVVI